MPPYPTRQRQHPSFWAVLLLAFALGAPVQAASTCTKRLRWSDDPPYSMRLPDGRIGGWSVDLTQAVMQRMGCQVVLEEMPFARALAELKAGRLDLLDGAFPLPERQAYAYFSKPIVRSRNVVFVREADRARYRGQTLEELHREGWIFGAQLGVMYGPAYAALRNEDSFRAKLQLVPRRVSLWHMLSLGRVDVVMADELTAAHELAKIKLNTRIVATPLVVSADPAAMAFSKATTDLAFVQRYDATLQALQADGTYQRLRQQYGLQAPEDPSSKP
jgi:polar amino acid transport system substrate-binding protein